MTLEEFPSLNALKENEEINYENVKIIIKELTEKLKKSTVKLCKWQSAKAINEPFSFRNN